MGLRTVHIARPPSPEPDAFITHQAPDLSGFLARLVA
jgi:hypothetical protein